MITIATLLHLQDELRNFSKEKLSLGLKYKLEIYFEELKKRTTPIETQRVARIKELSNGGNNIPQEIEGQANPVFDQFVKEYQELLESPTELPSMDKFIHLDVISSIETNNTYPLIFKHLVYELEKVAPVESVPTN